MANELKILAGITFQNSNLKDIRPSEQFSVTQTNQEMDAGVVSVGTSEEDLAFVDITTNGYLWLRNLDSTNYVQYGPKSAGNMVAFGRIKPGEVAILRLDSGVTLRWIANTAAVKIQFVHYGN